jgi:hypothetical protein
MGNNSATSSKRLGRFTRAAEVVKRLFTRGRGEELPHPLAAPEPPRGAQKMSAQPSRAPRRETDIPMDVLAATYTPTATSSKAGFRSDGADHQRDQEFSTGVADDRWNDEDHLTNKSGDPRIGTHRRTYEPAESRPGSRE